MTALQLCLLRMDSSAFHLIPARLGNRTSLSAYLCGTADTSEELPPVTMYKLLSYPPDEFLSVDPNKKRKVLAEHKYLELLLCRKTNPIELQRELCSYL